MDSLWRPRGRSRVAISPLAPGSLLRGSSYQGIRPGPPKPVCRTWIRRRNPLQRRRIDLFGAPNGNRTRVFAVKGRRPGPLDDGRGLVENPVLPDRRDAIRSAVRAGKPDGRPRKTTATNTEETMRAIRIDHPGGPEVMRLEEVELPPLAKGEVRLRQHAIGINFIDIYHRTGFYPPAK